MGNQVSACVGPRIRKKHTRKPSFSKGNGKNLPKKSSSQQKVDQQKPEEGLSDQNSRQIPEHAEQAKQTPIKKAGKAPDIFSSAAHPPKFFTTSNQSSKAAPVTSNGVAKHSPRSRSPSPPGNISNGPRQSSRSPSPTGNTSNGFRVSSRSPSPKGNISSGSRQGSRSPSPRSNIPNVSHKSSRSPSPRLSHSNSSRKSSRSPSPKNTRSKTASLAGSPIKTSGPSDTVHLDAESSQDSAKALPEREASFKQLLPAKSILKKPDESTPLQKRAGMQMQNPKKAKGKELGVKKKISFKKPKKKTIFQRYCPCCPCIGDGKSKKWAKKKPWKANKPSHQTSSPTAGGKKSSQKHRTPSPQAIKTPSETPKQTKGTPDVTARKSHSTSLKSTDGASKTKSAPQHKKSSPGAKKSISQDLKADSSLKVPASSTTRTRLSNSFEARTQTDPDEPKLEWPFKTYDRHNKFVQLEHMKGTSAAAGRKASGTPKPRTSIFGAYTARKSRSMSPKTRDPKSKEKDAEKSSAQTKRPKSSEGSVRGSRQSSSEGSTKGSRPSSSVGSTKGSRPSSSVGSTKGSRPSSSEASAKSSGASSTLASTKGSKPSSANTSEGERSAAQGRRHAKKGQGQSKKSTTGCLDFLKPAKKKKKQASKPASKPAPKEKPDEPEKDSPIATPRIHVGKPFTVPVSTVGRRQRIGQLRAEKWRRTDGSQDRSVAHHQKLLTDARLLEMRSRSLQCPLLCRSSADRLGSYSAPSALEPACLQPPKRENYRAYTPLRMPGYTPYFRPTYPAIPTYAPNLWAPPLGQGYRDIYNRSTFPSLAKFPYMVPSMGFSSADLPGQFYKHLYNPDVHARLRTPAGLGSLVSYRSLQPLPRTPGLSRLSRGV